MANDVAPRATMVTGWIALDTLDGLPVALYPDTLMGARAASRPRFAIVSSYRGERFHPETVRRLGSDPVLRARVADRLTDLVARDTYDGIVLDLEALEPEDARHLVTVVGTLGAAARRGGAREIALAVPAGDTLAFPPRELRPVIDRFLVMLYDQHWSGSTPGPVAARDWAAASLALWVGLVGPDRVVAALPVYGYHWRPGAPTDIVGWDDVQRLAWERGVAPARDTASGSLRVQFADGGDLWLSDGPLLAQLLEDVRAHGVRTVAIWRLGLEDPSVWRTLGVR